MTNENQDRQAREAEVTETLAQLERDLEWHKTELGEADLLEQEHAESVENAMYERWEQEQALATSRDQQWWFDEAWQERGELLSQVGMRPADPQASLARLVRDRDAASERLTRMQKSAAMLPEGHRGVLGQLVAAADVEYTRGAAQVAEMTAAILDGSHPQVAALAEWDATHGLAAERITALTRQCTEHVTQLSMADWSIPAPPTSEADREIWLAMSSDYAAMSARVERNGHTTQVDVDALTAHREMAAERGSTIGRAGYGEELLRKDAQGPGICF